MLNQSGKWNGRSPCPFFSLHADGTLPNSTFSLISREITIPLEIFHPKSIPDDTSDEKPPTGSMKTIICCPNLHFFTGTTRKHTHFAVQESHEKCCKAKKMADADCLGGCDVSERPTARFMKGR